MGIGINLKQILKEKKLTVRELSKRSGVSENTLYAIIKRDNKKIDSFILGQLVSSLNIDIEDLITNKQQLITTSSKSKEILNESSNNDTYSSLINSFLELDSNTQKQVIDFMKFLKNQTK